MLQARRDPQRLILAFLPLWAFAPIMLSPLSSEGIFVNFTENLLWVGLALTLAMEQVVAKARSACEDSRESLKDAAPR